MDTELPIEYLWEPSEVRMEVIDGQPPAGFDCGRQAQNAFLYNRAWRDAKAAMSVTHLLFINDVLAGFVTLLADGITLSRAERPRGVMWRIAPAMKIGQLAVDRQFAGKGLGMALIKYAIQFSINVRSGFGCRFITLDAEPELLAWYRKLGFVQNLEAQDYRIELARRSGRDLEALPISMRYDLREAKR